MPAVVELEAKLVAELPVVEPPNRLAAEPFAVGPFVAEPFVVQPTAVAYKPAAGPLAVVAVVAAGGATAGLANLPAVEPIAAASWLVVALAEPGSKG